MVIAGFACRCELSGLDIGSIFFRTGRAEVAVKRAIGGVQNEMAVRAILQMPFDLSSNRRREFAL